MRRLWAALTLIAVTVGICVFHQYNLNRVYKETGRYLKRMVSQYDKGEYSKAAFTANELENNWKNNEKALGAFVTEDKLENVRIVIAELPYLAETEGHEFSIHVKKLNTALEHILEKEKPRVY